METTTKRPQIAAKLNLFPKLNIRSFQKSLVSTWYTVRPANTTRHVILSVDVVTSFAVIAAVGSRHPCGPIFSLLDSTFRYAGVYTAVAVNTACRQCRQNPLFILVYMGAEAL